MIHLMTFCCHVTFCYVVLDFVVTFCDAMLHFVTLRDVAVYYVMFRISNRKEGKK